MSARANSKLPNQPQKGLNQPTSPMEFILHPESFQATRDVLDALDEKVGYGIMVKEAERRKHPWIVVQNNFMQAKMLKYHCLKPEPRNDE